MTLMQAVTNSTVLSAKDQAMKLYTKQMDTFAHDKPRGVAPEVLKDQHERTLRDVKDVYDKQTIFGSQEVIDGTWQGIEENLTVLEEKYSEDNARRLEKALVSFANILL